jgi:hypothetical protein
VPKENAGMVVAAEEALLACCENPPNAVAAAGPPNAAVLLPSITAAALCAPNKPYEPARVERDGEDPAARHDHGFTQAHARSLRGRERGDTSGGQWEPRADRRGSSVERRGTGTEGKRRGRRVPSRFAHHTKTTVVVVVVVVGVVVVVCVCTAATCLRVGKKRKLGQYSLTGEKRAGGRAASGDGEGTERPSLRKVPSSHECHRTRAALPRLRGKSTLAGGTGTDPQQARLQTSVAQGRMRMQAWWSLQRRTQ